MSVVGLGMDGGRTLEKVARAGRTAVIRTWQALSRTSAVLAVVMSFLAKRSERMAARYRAATGRLERFARWSHAKALGVPLGADIAGDDWQEPTLLPLAPEPPPIPPAAFFRGPPTPSEEEWAAAILAAKEGTPAPVSPADDWGAALKAAKEGTPAPQPQLPSEPAPKPAAPEPALQPTPKAAAPRPRELRPIGRQPAPRPMERRVGPKPVAPLAVAPQITLKEAAPLAAAPEVAPKPVGRTVDPHVAAAARKAIAAALRP